MPAGEMKGITVKIEADLHAEVKAYLETHEMTMGEFIALAAEDELHPKLKEGERKSLENTRTLAFQVPEELFHRIKEYLKRNGMTQKQFVMGLIEDELERDAVLQQESNKEEIAEEDEDLDDFEDEEDEVSSEDFDDESGEESESDDEEPASIPEM